MLKISVLAKSSDSTCEQAGVQPIQPFDVLQASPSSFAEASLFAEASPDKSEDKRLRPASRTGGFGLAELVLSIVCPRVLTRRKSRNVPLLLRCLSSSQN
jgi:hypothetical protein